MVFILAESFVQLLSLLMFADPRIDDTWIRQALSMLKMVNVVSVHIKYHGINKPPSNFAQLLPSSVFQTFLGWRSCFAIRQYIHVIFRFKVFYFERCLISRNFRRVCWLSSTTILFLFPIFSGILSKTLLKNSLNPLLIWSSNFLDYYLRMSFDSTSWFCAASPIRSLLI